MSHGQETWEVRNQVSGITLGTPKVTWLAKYSKWLSWKVPVAGATYTSLILLMYNTILYTCLYLVEFTRTVVRVSCTSYVRYLFFTGIHPGVCCICTSVYCTCKLTTSKLTCARTHIRPMYWVFAQFHSPYPTLRLLHMYTYTVQYNTNI